MLGTTQPVDSEEEGQSSTVNKQWLKGKRNDTPKCQWKYCAAEHNNCL